MVELPISKLVCFLELQFFFLTFFLSLHSPLTDIQQCSSLLLVFLDG